MPDVLLVAGDVCAFSQLRTLISSHPIIFATSFCFSSKSSRLFRITSPMVLISLGYALSFGFFPLRRTRQKSNATSQQRQGLVLREMLQEAQSEFLTVVFDPLLATIDRATLAQFFAVPVAVFGPGDF